MVKKVCISGYYGADNFGDETILSVLIKKLKELKADITVFSTNPDKTSKTHNVKSVKSFKIISVLSNLIFSDVLISGGGSLLQDVTSSKSLFYYLFIIFMAQLFGKDVIIFAQGIGPINNKFGEFLTKILLKRCKYVCVRDDKSLFLLRGWGINTDLVCDPLYDLPIHSSNPQNKIGIQLRSFKTLNEKLLITLANRVAIDFADKDIEIYSFQDSNDLKVCEQFESLLLSVNPNLKTTVISNKTSDEIIKMFSNLDFLIAMRYHAILIGLKYGVRTLAINYDYKIESIANEAGIPYLSMLVTENYGYMFNMLKNLDRRKILEYINSKHFNWDKIEQFIK